MMMHNFVGWFTRCSVLLLPCWSLAGGAVETVATEKTYDLYLVIGQSNMAGRGAIDAESTQAHPRVFMLNKEEQWVPAVDPLHFDKPSAGVGPGFAFGKAMADANPQAKIGLIPCAVGGTSIRSWEPGKEVASLKAFPYDDTIRRVKTALKVGTLKGIIWHQGEGDRSTNGSKYYAEKLTALVARLRKDLELPDAPFVAGELGLLNEANREITVVMNGILNGLAKTIPHYACVSAEGLTDKGDHLHFNSASARTLGTRYAAAMLELQKKAREVKSEQ